MSTTAPAVVEHRPLRPLDIGQTQAAMAVYQEGLQALLDETDRQRFRTREGDERSFVKRSGWRKISTWFELSLETRKIEIERDRNDNPIRARVIARAIAPNARYAEGEGGCSIRERTFQKPEHDLLATAATRATNRAISNLVGMGEVSAEEVDGAEPQAAAPPYGPLASPEQVAEVVAKLKLLYPHEDAQAFVDLLCRNLGTDALPEASARALAGVHWLASHQEPSQTEPPSGGQEE